MKDSKDISNLNEVRLSSKQEDYLKKEVDKLNSELRNILDETRSRERYSLTIMAGVAAWLFTHSDFPDRRLLVCISFIPFITTLIFALSVRYLYENITWIGSYLKKVEDYFLSINECDFGWERYFDQVNRKRKFVNATKGLWMVQLLLSVALVLITYYKST